VPFRIFLRIAWKSRSCGGKGAVKSMPDELQMD
jgi:hypothetical protein